MAAALIIATGCATLGGTTRHFDDASMGTSVLRSSQRLPARDHLEVSADTTRDPAKIRARVSRVLTCRVFRSAPRVGTRTTTQTANRALLGAEVAFTLVGAIITAAAASSALKACPNGDCGGVRARTGSPRACKARVARRNSDRTNFDSGRLDTLRAHLRSARTHPIKIQCSAIRRRSHAIGFHRSAGVTFELHSVRRRGERNAFGGRDPRSPRASITRNVHRSICEPISTTCSGGI